MRKLRLAVALFVVALSCHAALMWKKISLGSDGAVFLPSAWTVQAQNHSVLENAYGPGVSCRTLLTAYGGNEVSMSILEYWPCSENMLRDFVLGMAETLRRQSGSSSRPQLGDIRAGNTVASSVTFRANSEYSQKVAAFCEKGKIYCLIAAYKSSTEREMQYIVRNIVNRWKL